jgi:membrane-associated phospholipid phosphatase
MIHLILSTFLIVGVYQFYFWCQRNYLTEPRELKLPVDDWIPYKPGWVWIYSFLYYPVILYINMIVGSAREFIYIASSYLLLLLFQMAFFLFYPVATPQFWRETNGRRTYSERFLAFVQSFDSSSNSFPSMHTSVAMLTAMYLYPNLGVWAFAFPVLIGLSCLFTKQHYLIDVPAGAALGWVVFHLFNRLT